MNETFVQHQHGYKKPKFDPRRFQWKKKFGSMNPSELPTDDFYVWFPKEVKDQGRVNACTACATTTAAEAQFGYPLDECFQYAASKRIAGNLADDGVTPDDACMAAIKFGLLKKADAPFKMTVDPVAKLIDLNNYPQITQIEAGSVREISKYSIDVDFDAIRAAMWQSKQGNFQTPIMVGTHWQYSWNSTGKDGIIRGYDRNAPGGDHEFVIIGQKTIDGLMYLVARNSYGESFGNNGECYFSREIVNTFEFARAFAPGNPQDYKDQLWTKMQRLYDLLYTLIKDFIASKDTMDNIRPTPQPIPQPAPKPTPIKPVSQYLWDTIENAHHSVRVICDEQGLSWNEKNLIAAVIGAESGYNARITNNNSNGTTDWGICQINDGKNKQGVPFWIGPGAYFASIDEVLSIPEKSVRFMIKQYRAGNLGYWYGYTNGSYKKYL